VLLLTASLAVMSYFSRQALKEEAMRDAEQTLDGTVQCIDNILLNIEQATGNMYSEVAANLDKPDRLFTICRQLVKSDPYIAGCAVALKPYYYKDRDLFMAYVHEKDHGALRKGKPELVDQQSFGSHPYTEQVWYTDPMATCRACWTDPLREEEDEGVTLSYCLPIFDKSRDCVGVMAVDLPLDKLSKIMLTSKPSVHSYSIMLGRDGSYIIHPDAEKLKMKTVFSENEQLDSPEMREIAEAMMAGATGYKSFSMNGENNYIFYKPFIRSEEEGRPMSKITWSMGVIYPERDIFDTHNHLLYLVLLISIIGLLLFFTLTRIVIRKRMKPLIQLNESAQRIASGNYDEPLHDLQRDDEIGMLQHRFIEMQHSLSEHERELKSLTATLSEREDMLRKTYRHAQEADRAKTNFLHHIASQMVLPTSSIDRSVTTLCNNYNGIDMEVARHEVDSIQKQTDAIINLLNHMIQPGSNDTGKEATHE
jgi:methyl-accepting chemotaxis protein/sigma-B regulation protein RsbU (phosphoserine phosphatase)